RIPQAHLDPAAPAGERGLRDPRAGQGRLRTQRRVRGARRRRGGRSHGGAGAGPGGAGKIWRRLAPRVAAQRQRLPRAGAELLINVIYPIVKFPDPVLTTPAAAVTEFGPELRRLVDDMFESMYAASGVGLAAPQIGRSLRLTVIDCSVGE